MLLRNRAVLIAGSPGAGKSTISAFLVRQLNLHGNPARLFHEHDFAHIHAVERFRREWYFGDPQTMASWLEATPVFFGPCLDSGEVWVLDALYPGFFALLGLYTPAEVAGFTGELAALLQPVNPLVIYLAGDPRALIERAIAQRGPGWLDRYVQYAQGWHLNGYPGGKIQDAEDLFRLLEWRGRHSLELVERWPGETLVLDAVHMSPAEVKRAVLEHVGLDELAEEAVPREVLQGYIGSYAASEPGAAAPLVVQMAGDHLLINAYWEKGCRLVPEGADTFRLEATEQLVTFVAGPDGIAEGLRYVHDGRTDSYWRIAS